MPIPIAVDGQRVDGVDLVASCEQGLHQKTSIGLDSHHDCTWLFGMVGDEGMNTAYAFQAVRDSSSTQHLALLIQQADVVMLFRPINTKKTTATS